MFSGWMTKADDMSMPPYGTPQDGQPAQPPYQQPNQYGPPPGQPPYYPFGYGIEHPSGMTTLVLGILSIAVCQILGPFAWNIGNKALREIDANPAAYSNRGMVQAGRICGIVGTVILIAIPLFYVVVLLIVLGASA
jgi:hypothetical protein